MQESKKDGYYCEQCRAVVTEDADYCSRCGSLFVDQVMCNHHAMTQAEGVCVICGVPCCKKCGEIVNNTFLCRQHAGYEICQGMARVYGLNDSSQAEYIMNILKEHGLHPFLYSRKATPLHMGAVDDAIIHPAGEYFGHTINEIKVMVPFPEALEAEAILKDMDL